MIVDLCDYLLSPAVEYESEPRRRNSKKNNNNNNNNRRTGAPGYD